MDKNNIVDLWHHKRHQKKQKNRRNFLRRFGLVFIVLSIQFGLCYFVDSLSSLPRDESQPVSSLKHKLNKNPINIFGLNQSRPEEIINKMFIDKSKPRWLLRVDKQLIEKRITKYNPLISTVEMKAVLLPSNPVLNVYLKEELPWARFANGWLLTSSGRVVKNPEYLNFDEQAFASKTLIFSEENEYDFWSKKGKEIQKLIYSINTQLPELKLKSVKLKKDFSVVLIFAPMLEVNLGPWNDGLFERAARLSSTNPIIKKYLDGEPTLDLSQGSKAILKIKKKEKKALKTDEEVKHE